MIKHAALLLLATGCAATIESQSKEAFSKAFACPAESITVTPIGASRADERYTIVDVRGCGRRQRYACGSDWTLGCVRPGEPPSKPAPQWATESPGTSFPPTLVDQAPPPPPPPPDTQDGP